ncbi:Dihydropteroate synthase [Thelephora ganbajun]|uniref:Dihydropteroate synthase n=1 Tax=Thelephora ganbajun TaxID=370292 RepID=A0ACB6ZW83_THEGA|nr:Dihydropteroate synthase [Thelephora ganbajun]
MLIRRLGLRTRPRLRQFLPNPTAVCTLVGYGGGAPSALRRHHKFPSPMRVPDTIRINDLTLIAKFKDGTQWSTPALQLVKLSLSIAYDIRTSGELDDLGYTLNYASIVNTLTESSEAGTFGSLEALTDLVFRQCFETYPQIQSLSVKATKPKALLRGKSVSLHVSRSRNSPLDVQESFSFEDIEFPVLIGVNPEERTTKQVIRMNLTLFGRASFAPFDYRLLAEQIHEHGDSSSFLTVEAYITKLAQTLLVKNRERWTSVNVRVAKPHALALADSAEIEITRYLSGYSSLSIADVTRARRNSHLAQLISATQPPRDEKPPSSHTVAIAFGSNLGDRFANIELALRLLESPGQFLDAGDDINQKDAEVAIIDTSFLYETTPMYVTDQPSFVNGACLVETNLLPVTLLQVLKRIEAHVGRVPSFRNGPRAIDLDIILYDDDVIDTRPPDSRTHLENLENQLIVPHPRVSEREFVLRPLNDIVPEYIMPTFKRPIKQLLDNLIDTPRAGIAPMRRVIPFPRYPLLNSSSGPKGSIPSTAAYWTLTSAGESIGKTYIMATLNATPDSFSDGSTNNELPAALEYTSQSIAAGADIIDVGGCSTRPHAKHVETDEEIRRVVPVIKGIRGADDSTLISIDTFRPKVAKAAVLAGANCINDVHGFTGPEHPLTEVCAHHFLEMRKIARDLAVPVVLMHSRGEASANKEYGYYSYAGEGKGQDVVEGVRVELGERVDAAVRGRGGLRRWLVIVDPGIGFSKTVEGNLALLKRASSLTAGEDSNVLAGFPQLIGASKKSFLGTILGSRVDSHPGRTTTPGERGWATAAAVSCVVQQRVAIVRVHDVPEMGDVVHVADSLNDF